MKGVVEKCFVIMPFSTTTESHTEKHWTEYYESFLRPLIAETVSFSVERSTALRTDIVKDIIRDLIYSRVVVADITDLNANVLWELGVRQSFRNGTVIIAEKGIKIPFDFSHKPVLQYPPLEDDSVSSFEMTRFKNDFKAALEDCCENPEKYDSHVLETLSGRGTIFEIISIEDNIRKIDAVLDELSYNAAVFRRIIEAVNTNRVSGTKQAPTVQFSTCAVELLIAHRYLKTDASFYTLIINYHSLLTSSNRQINLWPQNYPNTQSWFLKYLGTDSEMLLDVKEKLDQELEKLEKMI